MSTDTTSTETHRSSTAWLWAWLASIMAFLAVGVLVTPAAAPIPDIVRWPLLAGAVVLCGGMTWRYIQATRNGGVPA
jgi:hypothetical protein